MHRPNVVVLWNQSIIEVRAHDRQEQELREFLRSLCDGINITEISTTSTNTASTFNSQHIHLTPCWSRVKLLLPFLFFSFWLRVMPSFSARSRRYLVFLCVLVCFLVCHTKFYSDFECSRWWHTLQVLCDSHHTNWFLFRYRKLGRMAVLSQFVNQE